MNYTIDTKNKTITINESVDTEELIKFLKDYKGYKVMSNTLYWYPQTYIDSTGGCSCEGNCNCE